MVYYKGYRKGLARDSGGLSSSMLSGDTIAAIVTPPGSGGVGIVRISGPGTPAVAISILGTLPTPRYATLSSFSSIDGEILDQGIAIYFPGPRSFTGEDVVEFQGHGGPVVLDNLLKQTIELGCRVARPGEFSERSFLNGKMDLLQAEAIADLIECSTSTAIKLANRTIRGEFSKKLNVLNNRITNLRVDIEAGVDFPEDDVYIVSKDPIFKKIKLILKNFEEVTESAHQGQLLRDGMTVVIAGKPNAGKSSVLNALAGYDAAIVTHVPGTTRDILRERIHIDGLPLHIVDTAGIRKSSDVVELEGISRARQQFGLADRILWVFDDQENFEDGIKDRFSLPSGVPITFVRNKIDLTGTPPGLKETQLGPEVAVAAIRGDGMDQLREHIKDSAGYKGPMEGEFMARRRHLEALDRSAFHIQQGQRLFADEQPLELLAEELRLAQNALSEITGEFLPDDLLNKIFSEFCIGK